MRLPRVPKKKMCVQLFEIFGLAKNIHFIVQNWLAESCIARHNKGFARL